MVAADVLVLSQVPPVAASVNVIVPAEHNAEAPAIAGAVFIVITVVTVQPGVLE